MAETGKLDWFMIEIMSQSMKAGSTEGYYTFHYYTSCLAKHSYQCGDTDTTGWTFLLVLRIFFSNEYQNISEHRKQQIKNIKFEVLQ